MRFKKASSGFCFKINVKNRERIVTKTIFSRILSEAELEDWT